MAEICAEQAAALAPYPLRTRPLAVGLLAASATGAWPAANLLGLPGLTAGLASGTPGVLVVLVVLVAVVLQVLFCITLARFVTTSMAGLLRSRRGKDLAAVLLIPIFAWPRPGHRRHVHPVVAGARPGAALRPVRPARHRGRPVLDLPAP
jgi:hypothetical protein